MNEIDIFLGKLFAAKIQYKRERDAFMADYWDTIAEAQNS